jgi:chemotaxis protein MotB
VRRRAKQEEPAHHDRWLVSYADFITLLFAFFVVLYSSSQVDKRKAGMLALSIQVAFQQLGIFDTSNTKVPLSDSEAMPFSKVQIVENAERTTELGRFVQPAKGQLQPGRQLQDVEAQLKKALAPEIHQHIVNVSLSREGVVVSLREIGFYESGSSHLRSSSKDAVDRLVYILKQRSEFLRVEGHTDNVPIHNAVFDSNWELSTSRSSEFVKLLILQYGFLPARLSAAGFAEYHPVSLNDTEEGRAHNRRVDIVILNPTIFGPAEPPSN